MTMTAPVMSVTGAVVSYREFLSERLLTSERHIGLRCQKAPVMVKTRSPHRNQEDI